MIHQNIETNNLNKIRDLLSLHTIHIDAQWLSCMNSLILLTIELLVDFFNYHRYLIGLSL